MKHFLKLIRIENLLIVAATQYLLMYLLIKPTLKFRFSRFVESEVVDQFGDLNFFLLVLATVLITAAGFVINDYFDRKTDMLNKPTRVIIGTHIARRTAMTIHWVFNLIGVTLGFYISWQIGMLSLGMIFFFISGLLWFYSTNFNNDFLIGNVIVSVLTGVVPLLLIIYVMMPLNLYYKNILMSYMIDFNDLTYWILGYAFFAFILTLPREILKDMEDLEGDRAYGRNSVPIVLGMNAAKSIVVVLFAVPIVLLPIISITYIKHTISIVVLIATIVLPLLWLCYKTIKADTVKDYHFIQTMNKFVMLAGIAYLVLLNFVIKGMM